MMGLLTALIARYLSRLSMNAFYVWDMNMQLPWLSPIAICTWDIDSTTIPMSRNLYAIDVNAYFLIKIRGLNSVEAFWTTDALPLPEALLLNSVSFHIFFTHSKKWFFLHTLYFAEQLQRDWKISNWYISQECILTNLFYLRDKRAPTTINFVWSYSLFKNEFRKKKSKHI